MPTLTPAKPAELELIELMGSLKNDPLNFVLAAYPWRQPGPLAGFDGPDSWQRDLLIDIGREARSRRFDGNNPVLPIRLAVSSGHGIGKSTMAGWLTDWILSTRPNSIGTVTANTYPQLETKTWPTILKWTKMCITAHWFDIGASKIAARCAPDGWFVTAQTCRKDNSEAFHGQHSAQSTSWYLFDEASAVPDEIWDAAEGGLTDGEPMIFAWGNPTRNQGKFHRIVFGSERDRWKQRVIDSRSCRFTSKTLIDQWIEDWGEDSDFVRVRVRGVAPRAGDFQFIDCERVWEAQRRQVTTFADDPLIAGFDVSGGGEAWNVITFRRGFDARTIPPVRIPGEFTRGDRGPMLSKLAEILRDERKGHKVTMMFVDSAYGAPYVERLRSMGFTNVQEVNFGAKSPDRHQANMRAYMWNRLRDWLEHGAIVTDQVLENDLIGPCADRNRSDQLVLESKQQMVKRGVASPDNADALALTFAAHVAPVTAAEDPSARFQSMGGSWMG
jgi:hypothetical protein